MRNWSQYRHPVGEPIFAACAIQMLAGALMSWGCLCMRDSRAIGMLLAFGMGAFVVSFALAAYWARRRPRAAAVFATVTEALLLLVLAALWKGVPRSVWYCQIAGCVMLAIALMVAYRRRPHPAEK